ncbi:cupin domain-containing protein [candidate division KSB1 bacterium]|nr:cupin domain-containing protein [candidate division KSB1 bacterium]
MKKIKLTHHPDEKLLKQLGVFDWQIWTKEASEFPWYYDLEETCYFLEGHVVVTLEDDQSVEMGKGDPVTFPAGMSCRWKIITNVKKHYQFG